MNFRKVGVFVLLFLLVFPMISGQDIGKSVGDLGDTVEQTQEQIDEARIIFLGQEWKELFLKNKVIFGFDKFFTDLNWFFVVIFARDYSFSLEMFFVFLMWLATALSIGSYFVFFKEDWQKLLGAFAGAILIAHIQVFNFLAKAAAKVLFYKSSTLWSVVTFIFIVLAFFVYLYLNKYFGKMIKAAKDKKKRFWLEHRTDVLEEFNENFMEAAGKSI